MDYTIVLRLAILIVLLSLSGLFSGAETSLSSINLIGIKRLKKKGIKEAEILERLLNNASKMLATILIGNNIVNIAATAIATELTLKIFTGKQATFLVTVIMTILILIFGEITPKTYSAYNPEKIAMKLGRPLEILSIIFNPILIVLNKITRIIIRSLGGSISNTRTTVSEEEIKTLVDVGEEAGIIEKQERDMIESIFEIGDIKVTEVMVPRIDIVYLQEDDSFENAIKRVIQYGYSRIPIIGKSIDNIVGIIYAKDLLSCYLKNSKEEFDLKSLIRPAYYVPQSKKAIDLLTEMQLHKVHISIVLDEYGGTLGLVTIEDILEEIVGDILDEYDDEKDLVDYIDEKIIIVSSKISIEEISDILNKDLPKGEFESLGGFVFNLLGRIPNVGDVIEYNNIDFKVLEVHNRRIKKIEITKKD
ncbi:hemolysin family protein [Paramaledivibacter caminithermalis]|uniref:Hemolysin, contains CBS domains n=1 Tax=Paramaledivibacter caminithermalis (strain DSM 15212 / CIP 107654 / DViRD3) TaxID=1121301 RepID=A0A1M6M7G1_PARC5|nr:hemolysin family protein [Paramaledivibacter caminithermalis]SHJ79398.1 Hemolysin, contains CBS domains [Paramaledivibacter caminithermalis DSM 15212]